MKKSRKERIEKEKKKRLMSQINLRVWFLLLLILGALVILGGRVLTKSLSTQEEYEIKALDQLNYSSTIKVAMPGDILDANLSPVSTSYRVYILILDPKVILATEEIYEGSLDKTIELVAEVFDLDESSVRSEIMANTGSSYLRYGKKTIVTENQRTEFLKQQELVNNPPEAESGEEKPVSKAKVKGVWFEEEPRRYYPYGSLASKLIGFTTVDTSMGLWGLEKSYDDYLRGTNGREYGYINSESDLERQVIEPQDGYTLVTTLDMNYQKIIDDELNEWYSDTDENGELKNSAKSVRVLLMDPNTGAIKAYASSNDFDLNNTTDLSAMYTEEEIAVFEQNQEEYDAAKALAEANDEEFVWDHDAKPTRSDARNAMWRNDLISDSYEPGSTGKVMSFAAAIEEDVINEDTLFECNGSLQVVNYLMKCHNQHLGGCGTIDALQSIANSCNVAFINIGQALGTERLAKYQQLFNLGQKTGIDLPGEASCEGLLYSAENMSEVDLVTNAFGQCYNLTMLQLASAVSAAINGGYYYKPYLGAQILDNSGNVVKNFEPTLVRQVVSEETSRIVREAMRQTVTTEMGTGRTVGYSDGEQLEGYTFIAKTGTAEKLPRSAKKYIISVVSAVPQDNPQLLLYVVIDEYGGELQADSYPAQELTGDIWGSILDYAGIYSTLDPGPEIYQNETQEETISNEGMAAGNEAWPEDTNIIDNVDGNPEDLPVPPSDDSGSGSFDGIIVSPDSVINPEDVMPQLGDE